METLKRKAKILHEITEALKEWGKYNQKDADEATRRSPDARQKTKNAMELLLDNLGLLYEVRQEYGCHQPLQKLFDGLSDVASKRDKPETDLGAYWCWGKDFTQPQLCLGNVSFIDECLRWASLERAKDKGSQKNNPTEARVPSKEETGSTVTKNIHIDLSQWNKSDSRNLMQDLLDDEFREGVKVKTRRHGRQQPADLKRVLYNRKLENVSKAIIRVKSQKGTYKLSISREQITFVSPKT